MYLCIVKIDRYNIIFLNKFKNNKYMGKCGKHFLSCSRCQIKTARFCLVQVYMAPVTTTGHFCRLQDTCANLTTGRLYYFTFCVSTGHEVNCTSYFFVSVQINCDTKLPSKATCHSDNVTSLAFRANRSFTIDKLESRVGGCLMPSIATGQFMGHNILT